MTNNDDILVNSFLKAKKKEIADNGFSRRVMRRLPNRGYRLGMVWQTVCIIAALVVFFLNNGLHVLERSFVSIANGLDFTLVESLNLKTVLVAWLVLSVLGAYHFYEAQIKE